MSSWEDLVATALLGTERRPLPQAAFAELEWEPRADEDAASSLLDLASAYGPYRRASARPAQRELAPVDVPAQDLVFAPPQAQAALAQILEERSRPLVQEWLTLCAERGLGVEPQLWPGLADLVGTSDPRLPSVYGERGRAFLRLRDDWARILTPRKGPVAVPDEEPFDWDTASAKERADHLAGLTPTEADLPLLEAALSDKRMSVASVAGERLSLLPGSAYSRRMTTRALAAVTVVRHRLRADEFVAVIPDHSAELQADGVAVKPPSSFPGGPRTWVLFSIVAATPLPTWTQHTGLGPDALLKLARTASGDADVVVQGWRAAAMRQRDAAWAEAFLRWGDVGEALAELVPVDRRVALAGELMRAGADLTAIMGLLSVCPAPWPPDLASGALQFLVTGRIWNAWSVRDLSRGFGLDSLPAVADAVRRGADPKHPNAAAIDRTLADLHAQIAAKAAVHRSFAPQPGEQP